jgi:hypothetical protein
MPVKNGLQAVQEIKLLYKTRSAELSPIELVEPSYVILTAYKTITFEKHLKQ